MPVAHPLADDPRNFARVLLELRGPACWSAALRGLSVQQLKQLIAPLSDLGEGKKTQHLQRNDDDQVGLSLCNLHAIGKNYRVEVQWSGLKLLSVATSCATAVIFYHSCLMRLRKMLSDVIGSTPDCNHEEAVRRAFDEWMHHGFTCPVVFQYHINRQAKLVLPCVQSLELALQMRRQALQATPARLRGLKAQWLRQAEEEALARHERTTRRAQQLIGFVLCRAQNLEPTVRMRKSGKQAPDLAIQVPVSESIARRLGETCESMQRRFASAEGQEALYRFLLNDVAKDPRAPMQAWAAQARDELDTSTLPSAAKVRRVAHLPCMIPSSPVLRDKMFCIGDLTQKMLEELAPSLRLSDLAMCGPVCKGFRNMVHNRMDMLCLTGFKLHAEDFGVFGWRKVIGFLLSPYVNFATKLDFSALPESPGLELSQHLACLHMLQEVIISPRHSSAVPAQSISRLRGSSIAPRVRLAMCGALRG
ncbi:unnamed protein product [Symbiodinium natans]|uniref:F-box domain-containing protein n=1 Tax=Symbiodinium natans TaxID=878477 RepID=A0A812LHK8_9DINO|nr:unnamed protein product [Symbiodinium natans]